MDNRLVEAWKVAVGLEGDEPISFNEYQILAQRTANPELSNREKLNNAALGLAGECGEVADQIKKHLHQGHPLDVKKIIKEAGDIMWYLAELAEVLSYDLSVIAEMNIEKLYNRYPDGFSAERSINRSE